MRLDAEALFGSCASVRETSVDHRTPRFNETAPTRSIGGRSPLVSASQPPRDVPTGSPLPLRSRGGWAPSRVYVSTLKPLPRLLAIPRAAGLSRERVRQTGLGDPEVTLSRAVRADRRLGHRRESS